MPLPSFLLRLPRAWSLAVVAYLCTRVPMALFAWIVHHFSPSSMVRREGHFLYHGGDPHPNWLVDAFQKFDSYWFLNIVREGYHYYGPIEQITGVVAGRPETNVTPFPLYPLLMKGLGTVFGDPSVAGLLVSQVCLIACMGLLYVLARDASDEGRATSAVWFFAVIPWGYAFNALYSESLYLMFCLSALLAVRRKKLVLGAVCGMLASLTRLPGVFIAVPMALELWEQRRQSPLPQRPRLSSFLWLTLVPAGVLVYFAYLWHLTGEPFAYFIAQEGWHKETVLPLYHVYYWLTAGRLAADDYLDILSFLGFTMVLIAGYKRIRWCYWFFALIGFLFLMSSSNLLGLPRYCAALFPLYFILADVDARYPALGKGLFAVSAAGSMMAFWVWTTWRYAF